MKPVLIAALYKFVSLADYEELRPRIEARCKELGIRGTLLLAREGINGTLAGLEKDMRTFLEFLRSDARLADLVHKESWEDEIPFLRLKVRLKKEIVTMGVPTVDPNRAVGQYVKPADWNALISRPDVVLVDTRNDYEVAIGTFQGAIDPMTRSFREFPEWYRNHPDMKGKTKVAMFCTGGIRCEKASSFLVDEGVDEVFHLEGGILKYLEEIPEEESLWQGECFVFDGRVSVNHALEPGTHVMCYGCRRPVSESERASENFREGVYCPHCYDSLSVEQKERFEERHRQIELAEERDELHLGRTVEVREKPDLRERALPVLYSFRRCPYAMRARLAILGSGREVELREVILRDKPAHMLELSPKGTVPVLWLPDGTVIDESIEIMDWALQCDPLGWTRTDAETEPLLANLLAENDGAFKFNLDRYKYHDRFEGEIDPIAHRQAALPFIQVLEERLTETAYLQGEAFGKTDAAILPFVRQYARTDSEWFSGLNFPKVQAWLEEGLESAAFATVMKKFRKWEDSSLGDLFPPAVDATG